MSFDTKKKNEVAIIVGAGPAGLTAAYELLTKTSVKPIIFEKDTQVGGISRTVTYKGNRIDIGGHRFFSKSKKVMDWWTAIFPIESTADHGNNEIKISYQGKDTFVNSTNAVKNNSKIFLLRERVSRIFFLRNFFDYPLKLSINFLKNLGILTSIKIVFSYFHAVIFPVKPEVSLEDFLINRFGKTLYHMFFEDYTEKVWGLHPRSISRDWGAQRIKGISIHKLLLEMFKGFYPRSRKSVLTNDSVYQKDKETSLIERFLYPPFGPGQLWEEVASKVLELGGEIHFSCEVVEANLKEDTIRSVCVKYLEKNEKVDQGCDYVISTMPIKDLVVGLYDLPKDLIDIGKNLEYRNFVTVGILIQKDKLTKNSAILKNGELIKDNWIYIQEPDVKVGRVQIFNNWSPRMVFDPQKFVWIGLEYFCSDEDTLWISTETQLSDLAKQEISKLNIVNIESIVDSHVIKMEKTYPVYHGEYYNLPKLVAHLDKISNLFLIGRNGMHKYNNQDHSMLTAMEAVENIRLGSKAKSAYGLSILSRNIMRKKPIS